MTRALNHSFRKGTWPIKALTTAIITGLIATSAHTNTTTINRKPIGDLEIYAPAKPGTASIFMMLDISGSMDSRSIANDYQACQSSYTNQDSERITAVIRGRDADGNINDTLKKSISFVPKGCYTDIRGRYYTDLRFDRLTRLQKALIELLADEVYLGDKIEESRKITNKGSLPDDYEIGAGAFSYQSDGRTGYVLVPTRALSPDQRIELIENIKDLTAIGGTPTAPALAEAGAYMMGTTTISDVKVVAEREVFRDYYGYRNYWRRCYGNESTLSYDDELGISTYKCNSWSDWSSSSGILPYYNVNSNIDHNDGGRTYFAGDNSYSGFAASVDSSKKTNTNENTYISPLNDDECSGNGIYLLTDGEPSKNIDDNIASKVMNQSLTGSMLSIDSCDNDSLTGLLGDNRQGWGCMASYSKLLRNPQNPGKLPIKIATVGFGKEYAGITGTRTINVNGNEKQVPDCDSGNASRDARNLCKLGERRGDNEVKTFGDGGFYYTQESQDIADSIVDFSASLVQVINTAPSGTITIPKDPYRAANQLPYAYLPMLDPDIASAASIWRGNLKKYSLNNGTLYGKSDNLLFKNIAGELETDTQDLWQNRNFIKGDKTANNDIMAGGVYAQLKTPKSGLSSVRHVYVEDDTSDSDATPVLRKVTVNGSGQPQNFDDLVDDVYQNDNELNKRRLLSFLGFDQIKDEDGEITTLLTTAGQVTNDDKIDKITMLTPSKEIRVLGGVVHSTPTAVSYGATLDDNGRITDTRDDYVLFGSMDGALHLVDADTGEEQFAIIPKLMMQTQPKALVENSVKSEVGTPYFGVDAPWLVTTDYKFDLDNKRVTVDTSGDKGMFAYGGLRMGGEAFYGIDISDKNKPKIKFSITPDGLNGNTSNEFARLGQIWSKPTAAKIRLTKGSDLNKNAAPTEVLIFGGGYDMGYEDDDYVPTSSSPARGNAIYMIDAKTGDLIWSVSKDTISGSTVTGNSTNNMIHSITGEITVLDRDNDGLMDHLYAADLGGQVFRADFENARSTEFGFDEVDKFSNKGVTRILKPTSNDKYAQRFYTRPVVSFYRSSGGYSNGSIFALVNVIAGNRSAPLSTLRDNNRYANRVYGIIDSDITSPDLYKDGFRPSINNLTDGDLLNLANELGDTPNANTKLAVQQKITGQAPSNDKPNGTRPSAKGWYYPLTRFDGYQNVRYNKGIGDMAAINNMLYTTVYNPDKLYGTVSSCAARIMGGSERQLYCLPYGICMDDDSITGTGGYIPAGQGIQELTLGALNADNKDKKVLIGTTTLSERIKAANRAKYGSDNFKNDSNIKDLYPGESVRPDQVGGDGSATEYVFNERYTLQPKAWYEQRIGE